MPQLIRKELYFTNDFYMFSANLKLIFHSWFQVILCITRILVQRRLPDQIVKFVERKPNNHSWLEIINWIILKMLVFIKKIKKSLFTILNFTNDYYSSSAKAKIPQLTHWDAMDLTELCIYEA